MGEKEIRLLVNEELGTVIALLKTADIAIGNKEYFGDDGQNVAITLDIASAKIGKCQEQLNMVGKMQDQAITNVER